ncbi:UbiA prenyltransferase family protein [Hufsiella ginkgonis]|uniref:Prenyltransferase n=1 Tax=Hufsiella ginkgonis TaxID=2695274 RepID=A0A7K1XZ01_9SPHI|nr:UbiA prenyltransferase family protein [Hufsiella ginkgonis]MXV16172.1 prenyltransferase [Hufsiella ginkgonis]
MKKITSLIKLLRVHQWTKNFFIFLPAFFGLKLVQQHILVNAILAFIGFSLVASSIYIFNDLNDIEEDKLHPKKKSRPLASGAVTKTEGIIAMLFFCAAGCAIFVWGIKNTDVLIFIAYYIVQNILYSLKFKQKAITDVVMISLGFIVRILIGSWVTDTDLSHWIILMTFLLALFLALAKRRDDVLIFLETGNKTRKNVEGYNLEFLNVGITIMASVVIICYIMYTVSPEVVAKTGPDLYYTALFVILGIIRYLQITFVWNLSGSPTMILLRDRFLQASIVGWVSSLGVILYYHSR